MNDIIDIGERDTGLHRILRIEDRQRGRVKVIVGNTFISFSVMNPEKWEHEKGVLIRVPHSLIVKVGWWITKNQQTLLDYWDGKYNETRSFLDALVPLTDEDLED